METQVIGAAYGSERLMSIPRERRHGPGYGETVTARDIAIHGGTPLGDASARVPSVNKQPTKESNAAMNPTGWQGSRKDSQCGSNTGRQWPGEGGPRDDSSARDARGSWAIITLAESDMLWPPCRVQATQPT